MNKVCFHQATFVVLAVLPIYQNITVILRIKEEEVVANRNDNESLPQKITVWLVDNMGRGLQEIQLVKL